MRLCQGHAVRLRQSYARLGPKCLYRNSCDYARQSRCMRGQIRKLHTYLSRVVRDIERKIAAVFRLQQIFAEELIIARRLLA